MEIIINQILNDLEALGIFIVVLGGLILVNTLISSINAWSWGEWVKKKFWQGLLKNVLIAITMVLFYIVLEFIPFAFERGGIVIPSEMIKGIELIGMLAVSITKYSKDIYDGLLKLLDVKEEDMSNEGR